MTANTDSQMALVPRIARPLFAAIAMLGGLWLLMLIGALTVPLWIVESKAAWYLSRASGTVAYLLLSGSMIWGLLLSTRLGKSMFPPVVSLAMHNALSWLALALAGLHAVALLWDGYYDYRLAHLVIPFIGPYRPLPVGLGVISLYIMLITSLSFRWRSRLGLRNWRKLHYATFLVFLMATFHGVQAGTDGSLSTVYFASALGIGFLTTYRALLAGMNRMDKPNRNQRRAIR